MATRYQKELSYMRSHPAARRFPNKMTKEKYSLIYQLGLFVVRDNFTITVTLLSVSIQTVKVLAL